MKNKKKGSPKFKIYKDKQFEELERGFFQTAKNARGLFQRAGKKRFPVARRSGPSVKQMYEDKRVRSKIENRIGPIFNVKFKERFDKAYK